MAVVGSHRRTDPRNPPAVTPPDLGAALRRNVLTMAVGNLAATVGLLVNDPGNSASLAFLALVAPLPVWAAGFGLAAVFQVCNRPLVGHTIAVPLWLMLATGAVIGLAQGLSSAPSASIIYTGLILGSAAHHLNAMIWRRRDQQARRHAP